MKSVLIPILRGVAIAVMAGAVGLDVFSGSWFAFVLSATLLAEYSGDSK